MHDPSLLLIGPLPRSRPEGVSMAFKTLVDGLGASSATVINTNWLSVVQTPGRFNLTRAIESVGAIGRSLMRLPRVDRVYLIVSTSKLGFLRDAALVILSRCAGRRVICHLHGAGMRRFYLSSGRLHRAAIRFVYRRVALIIVLGTGLKNQFRFLRRPDRIVVVPNGLPSDLSPDREQPRQLGTPVRLLYLSNLSPTKGITDVIESVAILRSRLDVELDVCGAFLADVDQGDLRSKRRFEEEVHALVNSLGLSDHVRFHGIVTAGEKERVLRECDILVLPTYHSTEAQPLSIIEAQAWGLPVVTTNYRAIRDIVVFGESGEACLERNPNSIARAVTRIAGSLEQYRAYSRAALNNYQAALLSDYHVERMRRILYGPIRSA